MTKLAPEDVAQAIIDLGERLPNGVHLVAFLIVDMGPQFESVVTATLNPAEFAPVLRTWLKRFDAGEANGPIRFEH